MIIPKACAEAYFPHITKSEGIPMKIQDVNGKKWDFQYRFWPNHCSRMYVLEGVAPCLQSMNLEAGDTVLFSRIVPEGRFVIWFRKESKVAQQQDDGLACAHNGENQGEQTEESPTSGSSPMIKSEKKRHVRSKRKRVVVENVDALTLRSADEMQEMLRQPPSGKHNVVMVDGHEFEEYEGPPVIGKDSVITVHCRTIEQWTPCDSCFKWRKNPTDVLLPPIWTCAENFWDPSRSRCSAPDELSPEDLKEILDQVNEPKKRRLFMGESSGLNMLANAAAAAEVDTGDDRGSSNVSPTTKHPKHRPGCLCTVCLGKGSSKSNCTCIMCKAVSPRAKVKMGRSKKHQSQQQKHKASLIHAEPANSRSFRREQRYQHKGNTKVEVKLSRNRNRLSNRRGKAIDQNGHHDEENSRATASLALVTQAALALERQARKSLEQVIFSNGSGKTLDQNGHLEPEEYSKAGFARAIMVNTLHLNDSTRLPSELGRDSDNHSISQLKQVKPSQANDNLQEENSRAVAAQPTAMNLLELNALSSLGLEYEQVAENHPIMQIKQVDVELLEESAKILNQNGHAKEDDSTARLTQVIEPNLPQLNPLVSLITGHANSENHNLTQDKQVILVELSTESGKTRSQNGCSELEEDAKKGPNLVTGTNLFRLNALTSLDSDGQTKNSSREVVADHSVTQLEQLKLSDENGNILDQNGYSEHDAPTILQIIDLITLAQEKASNALGQVADHPRVTQQLQVKLSNENAEVVDQNGHSKLEEDSRVGPIQANEKNLLQLNALTCFALEKPAAISSEQVELSNESSKTFNQNGHPELEDNSKAEPGQATVQNLIQSNARNSLASEKQADNVPDGEEFDKQANPDDASFTPDT